MKGYWVAHVTVRDAAGYAAYRAAAAAPIAAFGGRFLALGGAQDTREGAMDAVIAQMQALPTVLAPITRIRKEELN
jgi:uncharacterized protein (DUF1330 family)